MASLISIAWDTSLITITDDTAYNPVPAGDVPVVVKHDGVVIFNGLMTPNGQIVVPSARGANGMTAGGTYSVVINGDEETYDVTYERVEPNISFTVKGILSELKVEDKAQYSGINTYSLKCTPPVGNEVIAAGKEKIFNPTYSGIYSVEVDVGVQMNCGARCTITDAYSKSDKYRVYYVNKDEVFQKIEEYLSAYDSGEERRRTLMKLNMYQDEYERAINGADFVAAYEYLVLMSQTLGLPVQEGIELPIYPVNNTIHEHSNYDVLERLEDTADNLSYDGGYIVADKVKLSETGNADFLNNKIEPPYLKVEDDLLKLSIDEVCAEVANRSFNDPSYDINADLLDGQDSDYYTDANNHSYDNTVSGLTSTTTQSAIDEIDGRIDVVENDLSEHVSDTNNPHGVTAEQLGASNIINEIKKVDGAGSGLDADTLDGIHKSDILNTNGNYIVKDTRDDDTPTDIGDRGVLFEFKRDTTDGLSDGGGFHGVMTFQQWWDSSGGSIHQLAFTDNNNIFIRTAIIGESWGSWQKIWHEGNINKKPIYVTPSSGTLSIDNGGKYEAHYYTTISQNTTINISDLENGSEGTIRLYLNGTYTITLGTMSLTGGSSLSKHFVGNLSSLASGHYILSYKVYSTRIYITISTKFNAY